MNPNESIDFAEIRSQRQELPAARWGFTETYSKSLQDSMDEVVAQAECGLIRSIWSFGRYH